MEDWLRNKVLPDAVRSCAFGEGIKFLNFEPESKKGLAQFNSDIVFGKVVLENRWEQQVEENIVVKFQPKGADLGASLCDFNAFFFNELLFYSEIVPFFKKYDSKRILSKIVPEFVFGQATCGENPAEDFIILKSVSENGFKLAEERLFLDENHINLVLENITKFHALSYKCQKEEPSAFDTLISKIKDFSNKNMTIALDGFQDSALRGIDPLKNDPNYKDKLQTVYTHCRSILDYLREIRNSKKPRPVICHGDFQRNNIMFQYASHGKPQAVVFFEFQMISYMPPTLDLSLFLMVNSSPTVKQLYLDEFLETYNRVLSDTLVGYAGKPTFDDILFGIKKHGAHGYYIGAMFFMNMADMSKEEFDEAFKTKEPFKVIANLTSKSTTDFLSEMVKHMIDKDFIFEL